MLLSAGPGGPAESKIVCYALSFGAGAADFFAGFAGRLLPNEPLNIFPFLVFLSPLPIVITLNKSFNNLPATSAGGYNIPADNRRGQRYESSGIRR
jgi:hypothetical protein